MPSQDLEKWGSSHSAACLHPAPRVERWSTQPGRQWTRTIPAPCDRGWAGKGVPGGPRQGGEGYIGSGMFDLRWEGAGWDPRCPCPRRVGERGCWKGSKQRHVTGSSGATEAGSWRTSSAMSRGGYVILEAAEILRVELCPLRYAEVLTLRTAECDRTGNRVVIVS